MNIYHSNNLLSIIIFILLFLCRVVYKKGQYPKGKKPNLWLFDDKVACDEKNNNNDIFGQDHSLYCRILFRPSPANFQEIRHKALKRCDNGQLRIHIFFIFNLVIIFFERGFQVRCMKITIHNWQLCYTMPYIKTEQMRQWVPIEEQTKLNISAQAGAKVKKCASFNPN
jgi:hypothetical protein